MNSDKKSRTNLFRKNIKLCGHFDVAVIGGGPAGIAAAVASARLGAKTLLVEQMGCLGGMGTSGLVPGFCPMTDRVRIIVGGIGRESVERMHRKMGLAPGDNPENWWWIPIDSEVLKLVYDDLISESKAHLRFFTKLVDARCEKNSVSAVILCGVEGLYAVKANIFIDATGDGTLSFFAGASFETGDDNGNLQAPTLCSVFTDVDWQKHRESRCNMRLILKKAISDGAFTSPDLHLPGAFKQGDKIAGMNVGHIFGINGVNDEDLTKAMLKGRKLVQEYLSFYKKYVPGFEDAKLIGTGSLMGIRETRRITGEYVLSADDFLARRSFKDQIGRYCYSIDIHASGPSREDFKKLEKEFLSKYRYNEGESYGIPFRCLVPKGVNNLLTAGRCISTDRKMNGSTRVMPCCFITGQAAGSAAALSAGDNIQPRLIDVTTLQKTLSKQGVVLK